MYMCMVVVGGGKGDAYLHAMHCIHDGDSDGGEGTAEGLENDPAEGGDLENNENDFGALARLDRRMKLEKKKRATLE